MNVRRRLLGTVALIAAAVFALPTTLRSQPAPVNQPIAASLTQAAPISQWFPLTNGLGTCSVVVDNVPSGATLVPQVTSDTLANQQAGAATVQTASNVGGGSITAAGTYVGNVSSSGLTGFRVIATGTYSGGAALRFFCSNASSSGSGTGGGNVVVTNGTSSPVPATIVGSPTVTISGVVNAAYQNNPCSSGTLSYAAISISTATTTTVSALSGSTAAYVCKIFLFAAGTDNVTIEGSTSATCASGITALSGAIPLTASAGWVEPSGVTPNYQTAASSSLCILTSAAVQLSGSIVFVRQ